MSLFLSRTGDVFSDLPLPDYHSLYKTRPLTDGLLFSVPFLNLFSGLAYFVNVKWAWITLPKTSVERSLEIAHRAYVIERGHIMLSGTADVLKRDPTFRQVYFGLQDDTNHQKEDFLYGEADHHRNVDRGSHRSNTNQVPTL